MGHIISESEVSPDPQKVDIIKSLPAPKSVTAVRRFIGMVGYHKWFVKDHSKIMAPLYELTKRQSVWHWDAGQSAAFEHLKLALQSALVMAYPDFDKEIRV